MREGNKHPGRRSGEAGSAVKLLSAHQARSGMHRRVLQLQSIVGNQAVRRMLERERPAAPAASSRTAPIQRMEDPDGSLLKTLRAMYNAMYMSYSKTFSFPRPSDRKLVQTMKNAIVRSSDMDEARDLLLDYLTENSDLRHHSESSQQEWREKLVGVAMSAKSKAEKDEKKKKRELEELRKLTTTVDPTPKTPETTGTTDPPSSITEDGGIPTRKRKRSEMEGNRSFLSDKGNLEKVQEKLRQKKIRRLLMTASLKAHRRLTERARKEVAVKAKHNELKDEKSLGISELLLAQKSYTRGKIGDSLKLEEGDDYQVTMSRGGGQEIQQLGPYEPNAKGTSVKQVIGKLLKGGLNTRDLSRSIETRDPQRISEQQTGKLGAKNALGKIRALRHLHAIERSRGPEVSFGTTMEQKLSSLGLTHMDDYATNHPLAPPQATTDLRVAREKAGPGDRKEVDYVPQYIEKRMFTGLDHALELVFDNPTVEDPSIGIVFGQIAEMNESMDLEDESGPGGDMVKALELSMMSPPYVWPEDREHEHEDTYMKMYNELMKQPSTTGVSDTLDKGGTAPSTSLLPPVPDLPVKGLPNEARAEKEGDFKQKSDCFINAVIQLLAGPYVDYFDTSKHKHPDNAKSEIQTKVHEAMQMARGLSPRDDTGIRALRLKLLESNMVEGIVGHEDASELMFNLLRMVTDLEGVTLNLPGEPARTCTVGKDETLADIAQREGCSLQQLQTNNTLLDTSPIMMRTQSTRTIYKSTDVESGKHDSAEYTGGRISSEPDRGPGLLPVDMKNFDSFHEFMYYTFGEGAMRTVLDEDNAVTVIDDGQPKDVSEFLEQYRMLELPDVMTFALRRFTQTETGAVYKNNNDFDMPKLLPMVEHSTEGKKYKTYKLTGVGYHHGGLGGGHYTADVEHTDKWYHADDGDVSEHDEVPGQLEQGYIYTYVLQSETTDPVPAMQEVSPE